MPYTITFDAARARIEITVTPPIAEKEGLKCLLEIRSHPEFRADYGIVFNLLAADQPLRCEEAVRLGEVVKGFFPAQKVAIVWSNPSTALTWQFLQLAASPKVDVQIFSELDETEAWLLGSMPTIPDTPSRANPNEPRPAG